MLTALHIENYAIIDSLDIRFGPGMHVITGETGAGKSILVGALQLILGERAESHSLNKERKCVVEGIFNTAGIRPVHDFLGRYDLVAGDELLVRREIAAAGKSRSFINDTPVTLQQLRELGLLLVDLHQQFDTMELTGRQFQKMMLDVMSDNGKLLKELKSVFENYSIQKKLLEELRNKETASLREMDYKRFLLEELEQLDLKANELEQIEAELKMLEGADELADLLQQSHQLLSEGNDAILERLRKLKSRIEQAGKIMPEGFSLSSRINSSLIELRDIDDEISGLANSVKKDPFRLKQLNDRLSEGFRLQKKHGVQGTEPLIDLRKRLSDDLSGMESLSAEIEHAQKSVDHSYAEAMQLAEKISTRRKKQLVPVAEKINVLLRSIGMPNAALKIDMSPLPLDVSGIDEIEFLFQANLSRDSEKQKFQPLSKVASGGELSRLMLCIKSLMAGGTSLPTLIFDEIDTGISGEAALQVGNIMKSLSANHQLITITHQPQIAARAQTHFFVYKEMKEDNIVTRIRTLDREGRIDAIARMLGGAKPSKAAVENAKEMIRD